MRDLQSGNSKVKMLFQFGQVLYKTLCFLKFVSESDWAVVYNPWPILNVGLLFLTFQAPPIISSCNKTPTPSIKHSSWIVAFTDYIGYDECSAWTRCSHLCLSDPDMHLFRCECPDNMTAVGKWYWNKTCACPTGQFMDAKGDCNYRKYKKELLNFLSH